jgi:hypothetical protein
MPVRGSPMHILSFAALVAILPNATARPLPFAVATAVPFRFGTLPLMVLLVANESSF